jgi:sporulation-control protein
VRQIIETLGQLPQGGQGSFMQPAPVGYGQQHGRQQPYNYGGHGYKDYKYGGYRRGGMGSSIAAGIGGAALGFFGGMIIGDMISDAFQDENPDEVAAGAEDTGAEGGEAGAEDAGYDSGGGDYGGGDFGGGDFGGDF